MAITYFLILAYLLRIIFQVSLSPAADFGILMAASAGWMTLESLFLGYLKKEMVSPVRNASGKIAETFPS